MKFILFISVLIMFYSLACSDPEYELSIKEGYLLWDVQCGFSFEVENRSYKAENDSILDNSYKVPERTQILLTYIDLKREFVYYCGFTGHRYTSPRIKIIDIKKLPE
jgi:hypothetical protein